MTLNIGISRSSAYVLGVGDLSTYLGGRVEESGEVTLLDDKDEFPLVTDPRVIPIKTAAVTDLVLANTGGCVAIQGDFLRLMWERLRLNRLDGDLDACRSAAVDAVAELHDRDRPGELFNWADNPSGMGLRGSIAAGDFAVVLNGFRADGSTGVIQYQAGDDGENLVDGFEEFDDADQGEFTCSLPYGVPIESVAPFFDLLEAPHTAAEAFSHAFHFARYLWRRHPDRITPQIRGIALHWRGKNTPPHRQVFACNVGGADHHVHHDTLYGAIRAASVSAPPSADLPAASFEAASALRPARTRGPAYSGTAAAAPLATDPDPKES